ncbi:MAG: hypothetical protein GY850_07350 [bacterium]|nr:hypothetical protein [bacterium]
MTHDPFGNLREWGPALELLDELAINGKLAGCQHGLIRILRYKGNWRLREEVLKRIGGIPDPSNKLVDQVLTIIEDDNIYYDARILANNALIELLKNSQNRLPKEFIMKIRKVIEKLCKSPQPPFFDEAIKQLDSEIGPPGALQN